MFNVIKNKISKSKFEKDNSGFSLLELIIVIAIMGVLMGVAIPVFQNNQKRLQTSTSNTTQNNPKASTGNIATSQTNIDPKVGPVEVDSTQYEQCEGVNLAFYAYTSNILLSLSNNDRACS